VRSLRTALPRGSVKAIIALGPSRPSRPFGSLGAYLSCTSLRTLEALKATFTLRAWGPSVALRPSWANNGEALFATRASWPCRTSPPRVPPFTLGTYDGGTSGPCHGGTSGTSGTSRASLPCSTPKHSLSRGTPWASRPCQAAIEPDWTWLLSNEDGVNKYTCHVPLLSPKS